MRCIASSLAPIQTNPRRTSFRTIYLIRFYAPFPQCQHDGGGGPFSSLASSQLFSWRRFSQPDCDEICLCRPGTFFCYSVSPHHVCGASIPIPRRLLPKEVEISFLWAQTQTTPPPSKAFASSVMFVEEEAVAFDVVVAAKSLNVFFGRGAGEEIFLPR